MSEGGISKAGASKAVWWAKVSGLVFLVALLVVVLVPMRGEVGTPAVPVAQRPGGETEAGGPAIPDGPALDEFSFEQLVESLKLPGKIALREEPSDEEAAAEEARRAEEAAEAERAELAAEEADADAEVELAYLGMIDEGFRRVALLRVEGSQRFVPEGAERRFARSPDEDADPDAGPGAPVRVAVRSVGLDRVELTLDGEPVEIEREARSAAVVGSAGPTNNQAAGQPRRGPGDRAQAAARQDARAVRNAGLSQEDQRRLDELNERRRELLRERPRQEQFREGDRNDIEAYREAQTGWAQQYREVSQEISEINQRRNR